MPPPRGAGLRLRLGHTILAQRRIQRLRLAKQQQQQQPASGALSARPESQRVGSARATYNMWVSTNKVLIGSVGGLKKTHCRNPNFDSEETKLLISLWGDPQVQRTLITTHKKHPVIAKLAEKMREYGYNRSTEEINTRIKNLKCFYNRIKKDLDLGVVSETSWKHFAAMDDILTRPIFGNNHLNNAAASGVGRSRPRDRRHSDGSSDVPELPEDQVDHIDVKMELVSDDDKELRAEELLKNAEQVELREPNLLIPKDEPLEEDEDDPNDPDFEHDGGSETDDESSGMDEADETERSTRLRRRTKRVHKSKKSSPSGGGSSMTVATGSTLAVSAPSSSGASGASVPGTIKIINYTGTGGNIKLSTAVPASAAPTISITTLAGSSGAAATTTTQSKISLVPTNFLLKPQASNLGFKQPIQLYTKPTVSITGSKPTHTQPIVSTSAGAGNQPMKVFLVNTRPKDGSAPQQQLIASKAPQLFSSASAVPMATGVSGLPKISIQPKLVTSGGVTALGAAKILQTTPATSARVITTPCGVRGPSKAVGFKSLLSQLVGVSRENLGITKTRMVAERERFSNEKSVANAVLKALGELNALLAEVNATSAPEPEDRQQQQQQQEQRIRITDVRHDETHRRRSVVGRQLSDDEQLKTEVISDSEEG